MKKNILTFALLLTSFTALASGGDSDTRKIPSYIAIGNNVGTVLQTCSFFSGDNAIPVYASQSIKYIVSSPGDRWQQVAYGMPYYGIGASVAEFGRHDELGTPISLYMVQGATIRQLGRRLALNYELNLGFSTAWEPYDPFDNRNNNAIGSTMNVHAAGNIYLKWYLSITTDIHFGTSIFHASNGSSRQPNLGINTASLYFELTHNFNRNQIKERYNPNIEIPEFEKHFEHDIQLIMSSKNIRSSDNAANGVNSHQFDVYGLNYYSMRTTNYNYKYGIGAELLYDGSSNAQITRRYSEIDDLWYEIADMAPLQERLSVGLAIRGEIVKPLYTVFADIGYSVIQPNKSMERLYQTVGVKVPLKSNLYATFGVRATNFSVAQFLYWSLGYTFNRDRQ
ncbi:MAG: acyloxyacyl hydrolase [Rikenellaceae bacterium]